MNVEVTITGSKKTENDQERALGIIQRPWNKERKAEIKEQNEQEYECVWECVCTYVFSEEQEW